jgi:CheY-like chemotaxis protein
MSAHPVEILMVDDNRADVELLREGLASWDTATHLTVIEDADQALAYLRREKSFSHAPTPELVFLDWNLPRKDGGDFLQEMKSDDRLASIPVIVMTTSSRELDIRRAYRLHANCYLTKPFDLDEYVSKVKAVEEFWLNNVTLPEHAAPSI